MSLDKNLFTLVVTPSPKDPGVVDLVDPSGTVHYRKQRIPEATYKVEVYGTFLSIYLSIYVSEADFSLRSSL